MILLYSDAHGRCSLVKHVANVVGALVVVMGYKVKKWEDEFKHLINNNSWAAAAAVAVAVRDGSCARWAANMRFYCTGTPSHRSPQQSVGRSAFFVGRRRIDDDDGRMDSASLLLRLVFGPVNTNQLFVMHRRAAQCTGRRQRLTQQHRRW